jgi:hypothetical protein
MYVAVLHTGTLIGPVLWNVFDSENRETLLLFHITYLTMCYVQTYVRVVVGVLYTFILHVVIADSVVAFKKWNVCTS